MKRLSLFFIAAFLIGGLFLAFFTPSLKAQDIPTQAATLEAAATEPAPPPSQPTEADNYAFALDLLSTLASVIVAYLLYRSVPADKVEGLLNKAAAGAKKTATPWDDLAVEVAAFIDERLRQLQSKQGDSAASAAASPAAPE